LVDELKILSLLINRRAGMPTGRLNMRRIRDVLRLKASQGLSERAIAVSLWLGKGREGKGREVWALFCGGLATRAWVGRFAMGFMTTALN
jgi:hypothetical protein